MMMMMMTAMMVMIMMHACAPDRTQGRAATTESTPTAPQRECRGQLSPPSNRSSRRANHHQSIASPGLSTGAVPATQQRLTGRAALAAEGRTAAPANVQAR